MDGEVYPNFNSKLQDTLDSLCTVDPSKDSSKDPSKADRNHGEEPVKKMMDTSINTNQTVIQRLDSLVLGTSSPTPNSFEAVNTASVSGILSINIQMNQIISINKINKAH